MDQTFLYLIPVVLVAWAGASFMLYKTEISKSPMGPKVRRRRRNRRILELE
ncbi:hypothetical protein K1X76_06795 [bacterium]|nr:hypothetical protein [bacterium]